MLLPTVTMKLQVAFVLLFLSVCSKAEESIYEIADAFIKNLVEDSLLDFKVYFIHHDYFEDGSIKHTDTAGFAFTPNKTVDFKLSSLGEKKIAELVKKAEDVGVELSVLENKHAKNITKTYGTKEQEKLDSPAAEILDDVGGYDVGILEQIFNTLYETKNVAKIDSYEFFDAKQVKRQITMTIHAKEVMVKDKKRMGGKMLEEAKTLLKKALKVDVEDKALYVAHQFDERYPKYKWTVLINSSAYTFKHDLMVTLKYENLLYTILGIQITG